MNKISQKQINDAVETFVSRAAVAIKEGHADPVEEMAYRFKQAIRWYRMVEINNNVNHADVPNVSELTSSDTIKLHVDHWPEILDYLRSSHPNRYEIYQDSISVFCKSKKEYKRLAEAIDNVRSVRDQKSECEEVGHEG